LTDLNASGCDLTELPAEWSGLSSLLLLNLSDNAITELPPGIGSLEALQVLNISGNYLIAIPPSLADMASLWLVYLGNNSLYCFDGEQMIENIPAFLLNGGNPWIDGLYQQDCTVAGCTDPLAYQFSTDFLVDDGSCIYPFSGDVNGDHTTDILDIILIVSIIIDGDIPSDAQLFAGDLNSDGSLNILDVVLIIQSILMNGY